MNGREKILSSKACRDRLSGRAKLYIWKEHMGADPGSHTVHNRVTLIGKDASLRAVLSLTHGIFHPLVSYFHM